jgi:hypothetical protein
MTPRQFAEIIVDAQIGILNTVLHMHNIDEVSDENREMAVREKLDLLLSDVNDKA